MEKISLGLIGLTPECCLRIGSLHLFVVFDLVFHNWDKNISAMTCFVSDWTTYLNPVSQQVWNCDNVTVAEAAAAMWNVTSSCVKYWHVSASVSCITCRRRPQNVQQRSSVSVRKISISGCHGESDAKVRVVRLERCTMATCTRPKVLAVTANRIHGVGITTRTTFVFVTSSPTVRCCCCCCWWHRWWFVRLRA